MGRSRDMQRVQSGRWNVARPQLQAFRPATAPLWAVVIFVGDRYEPVITRFVQNLVRCLMGLGMSPQNAIRGMADVQVQVCVSILHGTPNVAQDKIPDRLSREIMW